MLYNLSPRPGQKLISVPSPTSDCLPLFELLCWQGAHGSGCAGLAWSKEGGKSDLEVILMWSSPAHRRREQSRVLGQSFRDAESISGELDGYQGGEGPSTPRVFCVSYFTAHCKMVCSRNSFPVDNEFTREEIIRQLQNWQKWKLNAGEDGHGAFFCTAGGNAVIQLAEDNLAVFTRIQSLHSFHPANPIAKKLPNKSGTGLFTTVMTPLNVMEKLSKQVMLKTVCPSITTILHKWFHHRMESFEGVK